MTLADLAAAAGLGLSTVISFERSLRQIRPRSANAIRAALERAGVAFVDENGGGGAGVRLGRRRRQTSNPIDSLVEISGAGRIIAGEIGVVERVRYRIPLTEGTIEAKLTTLVELAELGEAAIDLGSFGWFGLRVVDVDRGTVRFTGPIKQRDSGKPE
jgi:hypothetical protein